MKSNNAINKSAHCCPLNIKLREIHDLKQYINNSHLPDDVKRHMMTECDEQMNQAWRWHYEGKNGYEIFNQHPMRAITRMLRKQYGMTDIDVCEINGKVQTIHAANSTMVILIVPPHDHMKKWLVRVAPRCTFDRWANSTVIEREFDTQRCVVDWLRISKMFVVEKLFDSLSEEVSEMQTEFGDRF